MHWIMPREIGANYSLPIGVLPEVALIRRDPQGGRQGIEPGKYSSRK